MLKKDKINQILLSLLLFIVSVYVVYFYNLRSNQNRLTEERDKRAEERDKRTEERGKQMEERQKQMEKKLEKIKNKELINP